jgi:hypothetical protein
MGAALLVGAGADVEEAEGATGRQPLRTRVAAAKRMVVSLVMAFSFSPFFEWRTRADGNPDGASACLRE